MFAKKAPQGKKKQRWTVAALAPIIAYALTFYGCVYDQVHYGRVLPKFQAAIAADPSNVEWHYGAGHTLYMMSDYEGALSQFKKAAALDPSSYKAHMGLGCAYYKNEHSDDYDHRYASLELAALEFRKALRLKPDDGLAHVGLGLAYDKLEIYHPAADECKAALRHRARIYDSFVGLLWAYSCMVLIDWGEDQNLAILNGREAVRENPNDAEAHYRLGCAYVSVRDAVNAAKENSILMALDSAKAKDLRRQIIGLHMFGGSTEYPPTLDGSGR